MEVILNALEESHVLRNIPLLGMFHRQKGTKAWKEINNNYGIKTATFNTLHKDVWQNTTEFMFLQKDWDESRVDTIGQNGNDGLHYKEIANE